jgi:hypothetical protein
VHSSGAVDLRLLWTWYRDCRQTAASGIPRATQRAMSVFYHKILIVKYLVIFMSKIWKNSFIDIRFRQSNAELQGN